MKFLHLADLHLGKKIGEYDLESVQRDALDKIVNLVNERDISTVVIAGDIYDSKNPSISATNLLDEFLSNLHKYKKKVLMISGNHDQEDKLNFGSKILSNDGIHIVSHVKDSLKPIIIDDVNFYLLPFVNKYDVRNAFSLDDIDTLGEAISYVIKEMNIDKSKKNVIVTHQAVVGVNKEKISGSEVSVSLDMDGYIGGEDVINASVYKDFDYVALGHIHKAYNVNKNARYPGALLKYHRDEANYKKSFTIVDTSDFSFEEVSFKQLKDVVLLEGSYEEVKQKVEYKNDFVFFKLTDNDYITDVMSKLKIIFPYACNISYSNIKNNYTYSKNYENIEEVSKYDLFKDLYKSKMGEDLTLEQKEIVTNIINEIWERE